MADINKDLVSIIVPVYNRSSFLSRCLQSIEAQDYRPIQLILVDNGSTDDSLAQCKSFAHAHSTTDFKVVVAQETLPGASAARNRGLSLSEADIVAFFDSDDEMSSDFVSSMHQALISNPDNELAICRTLMVFGNGKEHVRDYWKGATAAHQILAGIVNTQSFMAYKSFIYDIGGWNTKILAWNDYEIGVRLLMYAKRVEWVDKIHHRIYNHVESITADSYSTTAEKNLVSLKCVEADILRYERDANANKREVKLMWRALFFRYMLLKGWLVREHNIVSAEKIEKLTKKIPCGRFHHFVGKFMFWITALGIPGAWRIGRLFL